MSTENLEKWFDELVIQLEDWLEHRTTLDDDDGVLGSALAGWRFAVERDALEGAAFSIPALYRVGPQELRAGILAQTRGSSDSRIRTKQKMKKPFSFQSAKSLGNTRRISKTMKSAFEPSGPDTASLPLAANKPCSSFGPDAAFLQGY